MSRQQKFEEAYADVHGITVEAVAAEHMGDTYRLPMIAKCWRFWNMALDSVEVELPVEQSGWSPDECAEANGFNDCLDLCSSAIQAAGLKVAP